MMSYYTLYDVISHHDVTLIALECCSCDFCVAVGCIPTLRLKKKNTVINTYLSLIYYLRMT